MSSILDLNFTSGILDDRITFSRNSVGTYFDSSGVMQTAAADVARFDHDPATYEPRGILIEEARTNLIIGSDAPVTQDITVTAQSYTLSFYGTGSIVATGSGAFTLTGTGAFPARVTKTFTATAGTLTLTVSGTVQQAQLEAGAFVTSYIPTTTAAVTRAADTPEIDSPDFVSAAEGTFYAEFISAQLANNGRIVGLNGSAGAPLSIQVNSGLLNAFDGAVLTTANAVNLSIVNSAACSFSTSQKSVCLNGGDVSSGVTNTGFPFLPISQVNIGYGVNNALNGHIKRLRYYPVKLSDAQLQALTAGNLSEPAGVRRIKKLYGKEVNGFFIKAATPKMLDQEVKKFLKRGRRR